MTSPPSPSADVVDELQRRIEAVEIELFSLVEQLRQVGATTDRTAGSLDDLEDVLTELSLAAAENTEALRAVLATADSGATPAAGLAVDMAAAMHTRQTQLDADNSQPAAPVRPDGAQAETAEIPRPDLDTLHRWVGTHLAVMVRKTTTTGEGGGVRWCQRWWEHGDAVERFTALFLTHGQLSASGEPTWLSVYLRDHLDPHWTTLTSPYGPFYACSPRKHSAAIEPLGQIALAAHASASATTPDVVVGGPAGGPAQYPGG